MSVLDLSNLTPPDLIEDLDYEACFKEMRDRLVANDDSFTALTESDPVYKILEVAAYFRILDRQRVNEAALAVMIAYAAKDDLDQVGARFKVTRLTVTAADDSTTPPTPAVMEDDDSFRDRIQLAMEGMSVAGPVNAYIYHAKSADARVADVTAISPTSGQALITVLSSEEDGTASQDILDNVETALNAEDVRPLCDEVVVQSAKIVEYGIDATLYLSSGPESEPILKKAAENAASYAASQRRLGRNIRRSAITSALHVSGVEYVKLNSPAEDIIISKEQAGYCSGGIVTNYGGEDE